MKKTIVFLTAALGLVAAGAQAQNTAQAWQFRLDTCRIAGNTAAHAYQAKQRGASYDLDAESAATAMGPIYEWAIHYATTDATSAEDAFRVSAAKCLDNIDRVYRDDRGGMRTPIDALK